MIMDMFDVLCFFSFPFSFSLFFLLSSFSWKLYLTFWDGHLRIRIGGGGVDSYLALWDLKLGEIELLFTFSPIYILNLSVKISGDCSMVNP